MQCSIRKWRHEDAADLATAISNPNILNNLRDGLPYPYTVANAEWFISTMLQADAAHEFAFAITVGDKAIGSISVSRRENVFSLTGELGYYIAEPYWGKGIGTDAIRQICEYVFGSTDIIRIFAEPFAFNAASCRILEKNGFVCEGTLRCNAVKCGKIVDTKLYALLKEALPR